MCGQAVPGIGEWSLLPVPLAYHLWMETAQKKFYAVLQCFELLKYLLSSMI